MSTAALWGYRKGQSVAFLITYLFFASLGVFAKLHFDYADPVLSSQRQEDVKSATRQRRVSDKTNRLGELQINDCEK